jgi:hypothetical protein
MLRTDLPQQIQSILTECRYAVIATVCPDGTPWNTPLAVSFNDQLNMYWASARQSQHSLNIAHNPDIFAVLFATSGLYEGSGLYLRMHAGPLETPAAVAQALQTYDASMLKTHCPDINFLGACPTRLYKAEPVHVWRNDSAIQNGFFVDMRQEIPVSN